jgi:Domain of unknown function (DUF4439)
MNEPLGVALAAEVAAIYAYGVLGVHLTGGERTAARAAEEVHRQRRDQLVGAVPSAALPAAYALPFPVTGRASALRLAVQVEDAVCQAWRPVLPAAPPGGRAAALDALTDAAVWATRWRRLARVGPLTMPFPGLPPRA